MLPKPRSVARATKQFRGHWGIENQLHWVIDVQFNEDDSRIRKDNAPENLAIIRQIALNLLKQEKTAKNGVKNKRKRAGWATIKYDKTDSLHQGALL